MTAKQKIKVAYILLATGNLVCFFAAHLSYLFEAPALQYIHLYLLKIWDFLFIVLAARFLLIALFKSKKSFFSALLIFTLTRAIYYFPFNYEQMVLENRFSSEEAVLLSLLKTLLVLLFTLVHILLFFGIEIGALACLRRKRYSDMKLSDLCDTHTAAHPSDFSSPNVFATLTVCASQFLYTLGREIYDTVTFLSSSINSLELNSFLTMIFNYVLILALFILSHITVSRLISK